MYELLVLALLMYWPLHAYLLAKIINDVLGPWENISRGTLSTLLKKLEQEGLVTAADPGQVPFPTKRRSRVVAITPTGRERFSQLMLDTTSHSGAYQRLFHIKAIALEFLTPADQRYLLDHYLLYCQRGIRYQHTEAQEFAANPLKQEHLSETFSATALGVMDLSAAHWQLELAWAERLREHLLKKATSPETRFW